MITKEMYDKVAGAASNSKSYISVDYGYVKGSYQDDARFRFWVAADDAYGSGETFAEAFDAWKERRQNLRETAILNLQKQIATLESEAV